MLFLYQNCWFYFAIFWRFKVTDYNIPPDGKQVLFITYTKGDLQPHEHLANKNVELRIMPIAGGEPKTVAKLFGGQGTINVNSWSPDSKRVAFVSYRFDIENDLSEKWSCLFDKYT